MRKRPPGLEKFVDGQYDRRGRMTYTYFRRWGTRIKLPVPYRSAEWHAEYARLLKETEQRPAAKSPADRVMRGSFAALVNEYLQSPEYKALSPRTQAEYRRVMLRLAEEHGPKAVKQIERRHIRRIRDARADTPGAANTIVRTIKLLLSYAVECDYRSDNPAARMKLFKVGEWRAWSDAECRQFEERWAPGTMQRRAYALALYTGQRRADLVAMTKGHRMSGRIVVRQQKTDTELRIKEHRELAAELATLEHMSLLTTSEGKAFDPVYFGAWFAEAIEAARLPEDCVLHGLRKTAARMLAEVGCTAHEIMAITGHKSLSQVQGYTVAAEQARRADAAIDKLENGQ